MPIQLQPLVDGNFSFPVEIEGSPEISVDEITGARTIKRHYAVLKSQYNPLAYSSPDPKFAFAYLGPENPVRALGPILFFDRTYYEVPQSRTEPREISFPLPGRSAVALSKISGGAIGWNPYGAIAPTTKYMLATVVFQYAAIKSLAQNPASLFSIPDVSALKFNGATVDYSGQVWASIGNVTIPQGAKAAPIVEPRFSLQGVVGGFTSGGNWIVSRALSRYKGPVWQLEVVTIPNFILP